MEITDMDVLMWAFAFVVFLGLVTFTLWLHAKYTAKHAPRVVRAQCNGVYGVALRTARDKALRERERKVDHAQPIDWSPADPLPVNPIFIFSDRHDLAGRVHGNVNAMNKLLEGCIVEDSNFYLPCASSKKCQMVDAWSGIRVPHLDEAYWGIWGVKRGNKKYDAAYVI